MNEKIDELLWQAGGYTKLSYPNDAFLDGRYALTQGQLDKFAELIVKETMQVVANQLPSNQYLDVAHAVIEHYKDNDAT